MKETEKTMNLTNSILEIANVLMSKYSADIRIEMRRVDRGFADGTDYIVTLHPWGSDLRMNICVSDYDIRNTNVSDYISSYLDYRMKELGMYQSKFENGGAKQ